jgi:nickel-dependent lactate racemase
MSVDLLHIDPPYKHARHYIGWSKDYRPNERINQHSLDTAKANPLVKAAIAAGCIVSVAHIWHQRANRKFERQLKNRKDTPKFCPLCNRLERPLPKTPKPKPRTNQ